MWAIQLEEALVNGLQEANIKQHARASESVGHDVMRYGVQPHNLAVSS